MDPSLSRDSYRYASSSANTSSTGSTASSEYIKASPNEQSKFYSLKSFTSHMKESMRKKNDKAVSCRKLIQKTKGTTELIFNKLALRGQKQLSTANFYPYFRLRRFANQAFQVFDPNHTGSVSRKQMKRAILQAYMERDRLTKSLLDLEDALSVLDRLMLVVLVFIDVFVWLGIFDLPVQTMLSITLSLIAATVFMIGDCARNTFTSIIFLFVHHPFDVGDKVVVDGRIMIVYKMHLLVTIFRDLSNEVIENRNATNSTKEVIGNLHAQPLFGRKANK